MITKITELVGMEGKKLMFTNMNTARKKTREVTVKEVRVTAGGTIVTAYLEMYLPVTGNTEEIVISNEPNEMMGQLYFENVRLE